MKRFSVWLAVAVISASVIRSSAQTPAPISGLDTNLPLSGSAVPVAPLPGFEPAPAALPASAAPLESAPLTNVVAETAAPVKKPKPAAPKVPSFAGKLASVDKVAMTISVEGKTKTQSYAITSKTRISKGGKPAVLQDGVVGEGVRGTYKKSKGGKLEALTVNFGAKLPAAGKPHAAKHHKKGKAHPAAHHDDAAPALDPALAPVPAAVPDATAPAPTPGVQ